MDDYKARVEAGMAWLDAEVPGWERKIDLATFDLNDGCDCVLGQVLQDVARAGGYRASPVSGRVVAYYWAAERLLTSIGRRERLGFTLIEDDKGWRALEAEWRTAIKARFDSGVLSDDA